MLHVTGMRETKNGSPFPLQHYPVRPPRSIAPVWPRVDKPVKTWPALRPVDLMVVVTSARMSVWRAAPVHQTPIWMPKLTSVSPGEWASLTSESGQKEVGSPGPARLGSLIGLLLCRPDPGG